MSVRSKYLPVLSARDWAEWAYRFSIGTGKFPSKFTVTDADTEHVETTRA